ncbi:MAG TPA: cytochrome c-type biogenesis protein CcmH, partial [Leptolinea sp.]
YGDRVLAEPPFQGFYLVIYGLPLIFILTAIFIVYRVLSKKRKLLDDDAISEISTDEPSTDAYIARVEEELAQHRES